MMYLGVNNLFGYCDNNPIGDTDPSGYLNMSSSKVSKGNYKITVSLSDRDIRNIKLGVTSFGLIFGIACDVVAIVGGIPSMGISVVAAAIASVVIGVVVGTVNAYIDYKNYGKGAKITFKLTYKTLTTYIPIYKRYWGVYYIVGWRKVLIPYAYINGIPRLTWNK